MDVNPGTYYVNTGSTGIGVHITSASNGVLYQADCAGATIQQVGNTSLQGNVVQIDGTCSRPFRRSPVSLWSNQPASAIYVTNTNATVANCVFNAPNSWVIVYFNTVNSGIFRNNVIVSSEMWPDDTRDYGSTPGVHVINNTWVGSCNNMAAFYTGSSTHTPGPDVFENNIIGSGYWGGVSGDSGARTTVDYNDIWNLAGTNPNFTIYGGLAAVAGTHNSAPARMCCRTTI